MKKHMKAAIAIILLIAVMAANGAGVTASASRVSLRVRYGINIRVNGILFQPVDSRGNPVEPFIYAGTTYVPLRAISDLYGADIDWDGSTRTVILDTENAHELRHNGRTASLKQTSSERRITVETGIAIEVNGVKFIPKDSNGNEVTVILYNGTTFVPIRAISGIFGAHVDWEGNSRTVILGTNTSSNIDTSKFNQYQLEAYNYIEQARAILPTMKYNWKFLWDSRTNMSGACSCGLAIKISANPTREESNKIDEICSYNNKYNPIIPSLALLNDDTRLENRVLSFDYDLVTNQNGVLSARSIFNSIDLAILETQSTVNKIQALNLRSWVDYINDLGIKYSRARCGIIVFQE